MIYLLIDLIEMISVLEVLNNNVELPSLMKNI